MTGFLLILTFSAPGQVLDPVPMGVIFARRACAIAGAGMEMILEEANPGLTVTWTCQPAGEVA